MYFLTMIFLFIFSLPLFAQSTTSSTEGYGVSGRLRVADRWAEDDNKAVHTARGQFRMDGWLKLGAGGCVKLNGRLTTGNSFNSEWAISGLADGKESVDFNLRRLYLDVACIKENVKVEMGAMPARSVGRLGVTDYGWVDGLRVIIDDKENGRLLYLTVGEINDLKEPSVFKRKHGGANYTQAELQQLFGDDNSIIISISKYKDTLYTRAGLRWAVNSYFDWIDAISVETLFTEKKHTGDLFAMDKNLDKWKVRAYYSEIKKNPDPEKNIELLIKNSFGFGKNYYFELERQVGGKWQFNVRLRDGEAGYLMEAGFTRHFNY